jgi:RHS repeat-associated protein
VGLSTAARYDYRVLQASEITDANGNTSAFAFSPAALVTAQFVRGKNGEGDAANASVTFTYDLLAFRDRGLPLSVRTTRRVHHDSETDVPADRRGETIAAVEYSDGFGRPLQTRTQAEDVLFGDPVFGGTVLATDQSAPVGPAVGRVRPGAGPDNVVVSGQQTYDNKGRAVEKYEPFFAQGYDFAAPADAQRGLKTTIFYDPRGQAVRTVSPDGAEERVVLGVPPDLTNPDAYAPTPWEVYTYDANDNAGRTHGAAAAAYQSHWNTPASAVVDALGRAISAVARNGPDPAKDWFVTRSAYDIQGNLVSVTDALGRVAFRYAFDLAKRRWRSDNIDAGRHDVIPDALDNPVESRDSKGALRLSAYDLPHRPARVWARDDGTAAVTLRQRLEYGDSGRPDQPAADRATARSQNLLGQLTRYHDEAGRTTVASVDFKGNVVDKSRQVIADAPILAVFNGAPARGWQVTPFHVDWQPGPGETLGDREAMLLDGTVYQTTSSVDALNRVKRAQLPADVGGTRHELVPEYNRAGALERVSLDSTVYVDRIAYDAKGQRALVAYGSGVMTRYAYDPQTLRLRRLRSEGYKQPNPVTYAPSGAALQDYGYDYDLVGNILVLHDRTPGTGIAANPDTLDRAFSYDPIYRLLSATGREYDRPPETGPWDDQPRGTDVTRTRAYTEQYAYDAVGSVLRLDHGGPAGAFVRQFVVEATNNRLHTMATGQTTYAYAFDPCGNLLSETTSRHFEWNHADQMKVFRTQTAGAEPSVHAQYLYDGAGRRVKKLVRKQGGGVETTHYIDGVFEHARWSAGGGGQNNHLHVMDGMQRAAIVREGAASPGDGGPAVQVHLGDHLGSSNVVLDGEGALVNREEFTPYGETSFGSYARKRYRFTGMERDEESSLNCHGARSFAPWLGRWVSCDPAELDGGLNSYAYADDSPLLFVDPAGTQPQEAPGLPEDRDNPGYYDLPGEEVIEVTGTAPPLDHVGSALANHVVDYDFPTYEEFAKKRNAEDNTNLDNSLNSLGRSQQEYDWSEHPEEAQEAREQYLQSEYRKARSVENASWEKAQARIDACAKIGRGAGWFVVGTIGVFGAYEAGGAALVSNSARSAEAALGNATRALGARIFTSPKLVLAGAVGYAVAAPPGAPDSLGEGEVLSGMYSTAAKVLGGSKWTLPQAARPHWRVLLTRVIQLNEQGMVWAFRTAFPSAERLQYWHPSFDRVKATVAAAKGAVANRGVDIMSYATAAYDYFLEMGW